MLIMRVYEVDPLACPHCGGQMKVVAFMEPLQAEVIEKILRHCGGLWRESAGRAPPDVDGLVKGVDFCCSERQVGPQSRIRTPRRSVVAVRRVEPQDKLTTTWGKLKLGN